MLTHIKKNLHFFSCLTYSNFKEKLNTNSLNYIFYMIYFYLETRNNVLVSGYFTVFNMIILHQIEYQKWLWMKFAKNFGTTKSF